MTEFNLSDNITFGIHPGIKVILEEDVKEFIRRLKEDIIFAGNQDIISIVWILQRLHKLAGDKLIW